MTGCRWLTLCVIGCGSAPGSSATSPRPAPAVVTAPAPDDAPEPDAEAVDTAVDPLRTDVPALSRVLCTIASETGSWLSALPLRLAPGAAVFASVHEVPAQVSLSAIGPSDGARIAIEADGFALRGRADGSELALTPARAVAAELVVPKSGARLAWVGTQGTQPSVSLKLSGELRPADERPFEWAAQCEDLSLATRTFDAKSATGLGEPARVAYVDAPGPFVISSQPRGGASLTVSAAPGDHEVEVHATDGARVQILFENENHLLFGWTDSKNLRAQPRGSGRSVGYGTGRGRLGAPRAKLVQRRCETDLEIITLLGDGVAPRAVVGAIRANAAFWVAPAKSAHGLVELAKLPVWLRVGSDARLVVALEPLSRCAEVSAGSG